MARGQIPGFTVDENSDPKAAEAALKDLRRMIKYGRLAERALRSIRATGFYAGTAPVAPLPASSYTGYLSSRHQETKRSTHVQMLHLPERLGISRADLGPMGELRIEMGGVKDTKYAGNPTKEIPLFVAGPLATQVESGQARYEVEEDRRQCGEIRINKSHLSWLAPREYGQGDAHRVYKEMKYEGARESLTAFARGVSMVLVTKRSREMLAAAKTLDLQATAWEWFLADGHAERMFRDIHEITRVIEVMEA